MDEAIRFYPMRPCAALRGLKPGTLRQRVLNNAVVCRGDPGHWRPNPPPPGDDVTMIHRHYRD